MDYFQQISQELAIRPEQARAVSSLLDEGATIPFIARYRKEAHGSLDEVAIVQVRDRLEQMRELDARRQAISKSLAERELLSAELETAIAGAANLSALEDIYLPYRPKRRTRAGMAREKGLEPLAELLLEQKKDTAPEAAAAPFVRENGAASVEEAMAGARDIIAEKVAEDADLRGRVRDIFARKAVLAAHVAKGKEEEGAKYRDYFDWKEPAAACAGHRLLAMLRGEKEGVLSLSAQPDPEECLVPARRAFVKNSSLAGAEVKAAVEDGYKRLMAPSMETELRSALREKAEKEAIAVFARNLRELLLAAPLGGKRVLALDPGFRTGCKVVCLDEKGALLHHDVVYILGKDQEKAAGEKVKKFCAQYGIEAVAVGNGTAGRETEAMLRGLGLGMPVIMVNESGASVYSASETARREFPDHDITVRGAVSIGRRLMDPLAELVKIDPKAIGVGQYQHDVDQAQLRQSLTDTILSCVNAVGVELNTASAELLGNVSGLGPALAKGIVDFREKSGPFKKRKDLLKVPRLGPKAFEQAAGFLRIRGGDIALDASAVHPESYGIVEAMAADLRRSVADLLAEKELRRKIDPKKYVTDKVGLPTINDILAELEKPGRDPRRSFEVFSFKEDIDSIDKLEPGMKLPGIVTNVTNFGAFVDVGVHQDGLVHISRMAGHFVRDPHEIVRVGQKVSVTVIEVDVPRKRISLSMAPL